MLLNSLASLGQRGISMLATFGRAGLMLFNALVGKPEFRKHAPLLVRQLYNVGVLSMLIIIVSGFFIGMACTGSGPFFWMFLLFQLPSLLACYHPVNDAMALHNLPDNVLIYREGWQMKFYAPEGTKTNIKVYKPKPKKKR